MEYENVINLKIEAEDVTGIIGPVRDGTYGCTIDSERFMLDILLSIDELVRESAGIKIEEVTQQAVNGNIVVDLAIAAEKNGDRLVPTGSSERLDAAERLVLDILLSIDDLVHESEGLQIQDRMQKKIRGKIVAGVQIVAEEIEPAEAVFEDEFMATDVMHDPLLAGYVY
ncbi:hypothetical protein C5S39_14715 [Candidatus Methanophagaceae archaeon]|jgi:hypothetical protein|nr:hypothetical protein C5S39_14715 [Methanophagales archaeon]